MIAFILWVVGVWLLLCLPCTVIMVRLFRGSGVAPSLIPSDAAAEAAWPAQRVPRPRPAAEPLISVPASLVQSRLSA